ncbi:1-aminocyclopropane-1-carboxylate deaminase/D-cysteine desulfhydrase [Fulvivirga lutea]|uniref:1-aminocyclopropane-1-carboxylate deaminase/D-cysteine desulfhydrase n=1 Tax=Fulvivirga lutea TaxID=2810512 RepID=A0A974WHR2_9BACT|nr:pyridoxal-phosphate dependent enzyme [Fulvivirga lutea]QSE98119.1 1-aminocyclopropane-1-carboxylate deaminase/D-cysteine desulfhydrase [Fulvivirga lutea]
MLKIHQEPIIQRIKSKVAQQKGVELYIKREDLIHPFVSGNKWRKLKYNLEEARAKGLKTIATFGGAYSNHIYATAAAAKEADFLSIGIIRGEELANKSLNKTLQFAIENGMQLKFVSREEYRKKSGSEFIQKLNNELGDIYLIPEGGTNSLAIKGCTEILDNSTKEFDYICTSAGTGGTLSGLIVSSKDHQKILGFSSLKGEFLAKDVEDLVYNYKGTQKKNWGINTNYHFGGYAKTNDELIRFIKQFERDYSILLDQVYTGKMMYGINDLIQTGYFKSGTKILAIHTGGLQGRTALLSSDRS